jgi:small subunit ribosomal protein S8
MLNDTLANALSIMKNAEKVGKATVTISPTSKIITQILNILKAENYITDFKEQKDKCGGTIVVTLARQINGVGAIKPRFSVSVEEFEKFEKRYLPAKDFGRIILSTPKGIITHLKAKELRTGGVLLAYVY